MDEMKRSRDGEKILSINRAVLYDYETPVVPARSEAEEDGKQVLDELVRIMREEGMDPAVQLAGYFVTEDPTYLPSEHHARGLARRVGRDKLLQVLIEQYVSDRDTLETTPGTTSEGGETD